MVENNYKKCHWICNTSLLPKNQIRFLSTGGNFKNKWLVEISIDLPK